MDDSMDGAIDVVCNLFTPQEVRQGQTGVDEYFLDQVRFPTRVTDRVYRWKRIWRKWTAPGFSVRFSLRFVQETCALKAHSRFRMSV